MTATNLPNTLLKLGLALAKHHIKNVIGDEALEVVATTLTDVGGEKVQAKVDSIFASKEGKKELLKAAKVADKNFQEKCKDNDLRSLFTMGYGDLPSVQTAIAGLPEALDDETVRETLFTAFRNDAPKRISDEQINVGVNLYIECLQSALLPVEKFGLRIIHNALKEIGKDVKDIKADVKWLKEKAEAGRQSVPDAKSSKPVFYVPFPRNEKFVGREDDLERLHAALQHGQNVGVRPAMLSGMGGIGKTQLAVEYAYRYKEKYPGGIYWVSAAQDLLLNGMAETAGKIGLSAKDAPESQRLIYLANALARHLDSHPDALVIFDNVEDPQVLRFPLASFIPSELKCKILFTTRRRDLDKTFYRSFEVTVLPEGAALQLLLRHPARRPLLDPKHNDHAWAQIICMTLGRLPLAIELAGAYLGQYSEISLQDYRYRLLDEGAMETVDDTELRPRDMPTRHDTAISATLKLSWEAIQDDPAAQLAFKAAGQLRAAELISIQRLSLLTGLELDAKRGHPAPLKHALKKLFEFSLIEELTGERLRLHPLVQEFASLLSPPAFRLELASRVATLFGDLPRLQVRVLRYGIEMVLEDMRTGLDFCADKPETETYFQISKLERVLDRQVHDLRGWDAEMQPAFFLQQLRNESLELGLSELKGRAEVELARLGRPYLRERFRVGRDSPELVRTLQDVGGVNGVALSANGRLAVSASVEHTLNVWDVTTGRALRTLEGHSDQVNAVALSADGRLAVSASVDKTLKVWDVVTGRELRTLEGHNTWVNTVALSADGRLAVSAAGSPSGDDTLKVWDVAAGRELHTLQGHDSTVECVALSADGRLAVSASRDKTLKVWDVATGRELRTLKGHSSWVNSVALSADGHLALSASEDRTIKVWDVATGRALRTIRGHTERVLGVALSANGRLAYSVSEDRTIKVWDVATGRELRTLHGHSRIVQCVALSADGQLAVSASWDTLKVWDISREPALNVGEQLTDRWNVDSVALSADGRLAISTVSRKDMLEVWEVATGRKLRTLQGHGTTVDSVALSADGRLAVSASDDRMLKVWEVATGRELHTFQGRVRGANENPGVNGVALSADGRLAVSEEFNGALKVWDVATGGECCMLTGNVHIPAALSADGQLAIAVSNDGLKVWDVTTGHVLHTLQGHVRGRYDKPAVNSLALSADGRLAVSASDDQTLKVWDMATGQELRTLHGHSATVEGVVLSADGRLAVSASNDKTLKVWEVATGRVVSTLSTGVELRCCAMTPDGKTIVAGDLMGRVHFLEFVNLEEKKPG